jgi:hypothetical protein
LPTPEASNTKAIALRTNGRPPRNFLLPTPSASSYETSQGGGMGRAGPVRPSLETMARHNLWPTPHGFGEDNHGSELSMAVRVVEGLSDSERTAQRLWPTPTARLRDEQRGMPSAGLAEERYRQGRRNLDDAVALWPTPTIKGNYNRAGSSVKSGDGLATAVGGTLNPTWVEWLMGFPTGWTDFGPSATPSSPRSPSTSDG